MDENTFIINEQNKKTSVSNLKEFEKNIEKWVFYLKFNGKIEILKS